MFNNIVEPKVLIAFEPERQCMSLDDCCLRCLTISYCGCYCGKHEFKVCPNGCCCLFSLEKDEDYGCPLFCRIQVYFVERLMWLITFCGCFCRYCDCFDCCDCYKS
jgi:hypothetical protein